MGSKKLTRGARFGKLSPEQAARDKQVRLRVQEESPPAKQPSLPDAVSDALKTAIETSELTVYEIAKRAKVSQIIISRFLSGERDIRMATADKLAQVLALKLVSGPK